MMNITEIAAALNAEICQSEFEDTELTGAYTSDLLSDVIANAKDGGALITIQAHKNTVAVATLVNISVIRTTENQFTVSGKLWDLLKG